MDPSSYMETVKVEWLVAIDNAETHVFASEQDAKVFIRGRIQTITFPDAPLLDMIEGTSPLVPGLIRRPEMLIHVVKRFTHEDSRITAAEQQRHRAK